MPGENGCITTLVENALMIGNGFRWGGEASSAVEWKVHADTLAFRRSSQ